LSDAERVTPDPAQCPLVVTHPVMRQRWETLTFLHWSFDPGAVQRLLPEGLRVDAYDGCAWVGLVPFRMRVGVRRSVGLPWVGRFCETNVRTYVRDRFGRPGIWFFSLDATRLGAVLTARATYRLPYFWSDMSACVGDGVIEYTCRRRWPQPVPANSRVRVAIGEMHEAGDLGARDHFLTARWRLFSTGGHGLRYAEAAHPPWPLWRATLLECSDDLLTVAGLPRPTTTPLVHFSPGVDVRIGRPFSVGPGRATSSGNG
jgi:uncharacterized protein YqjF (DUF2071 family)